MKYIKIRMVLLSLLFLVSWTNKAQTNSTINVSGEVTSSNGDLLQNVVISDDKGNIITTTDELGRFNINSNSETKIVFIKKDYDTKTITLKSNKENVDIVLNMSKENDKVNVAFRKVNKDELMGGVSYVEVDDLLEKNYYVNSLDNLETLANGFHGNIWGNNSYLILVDGLPRDANSVVATEIDQVTVLKGVSAVALYGSRAAKGVVLITTKRGTSGAQKIKFRSNAGVSLTKAYPKYVGASEYMSLYNEARTNDGIDNLYLIEDIYNHSTGINKYRYPDLDFYSSDYIAKMYNTYDATTEISGGDENLTYYTNIGYWREGNLIDFGNASDIYTDRINIRGNIDIKINDFIKSYVDASMSFRNRSGVNTNYWSAAETVRPNRFTPLIPIDFVDPNHQESQGFINTSENIIDGKYLLGGSRLDATNAFADVYAGGSNKAKNRQFQFNTGIEMDLKGILKGLSFKSDFGIDYTTAYTTAFNNSYATYEPKWSNYNGKDIIESISKEGEDASTRNQNIYGNSFRQTISLSSQLNYKLQLQNKHNINVMLLATGYQQSISAEYQKINNINAGVHISYDYMKKYYLEFNEAISYSNKLPENNRIGYSPTGTLSWRISSEEFMKSMKSINDLRISVSGGVINTDLDINEYYLYEGSYEPGDVYFTWKDGSSNYNTKVARGANPYLTYPKRHEFSLGLNTSLFNNKISFNGNVYKSTMKGMITQISNNFPVYFQTGWPSSSFIPFENYNEQERIGYDFNLNLNQNIGNVDLSLGFVGSYYESKQTKAVETLLEPYQSRINKPLDGVWGLKSDGLFMNEEDILNSPSQSVFGETKPGDIKYIDQNGDNIIDNKDDVYLGRGGWYGAPLTLGVNLTAKWNNFTLFVIGTGRFGATAMKNNSYFWVYGDRKYSEVVRDRWSEATKETATYPRLTTFSSDNNFRNSDFWTYKADRFDLSRVQISYDFPKKVVNKTFLNNLGVYVSGSNLLTISANRDIMEINVGSQPQTRFFNLGVKAGF